MKPGLIVLLLLATPATASDVWRHVTVPPGATGTLRPDPGHTPARSPVTQPHLFDPRTSLEQPGSLSGGAPPKPKPVSPLQQQLQERCRISKHYCRGA